MFCASANACSKRYMWKAVSEFSVHYDAVWRLCVVEWQIIVELLVVVCIYGEPINVPLRHWPFKDWMAKEK